MFKFVSWGLSDGMSVFMEGVVQYHDYVLGLMVFIFWFVVVLVGFEVCKMSGCNGEVGGLILESIWTVLPMVVLLFMAYPSLVLLYVNAVKGVGGYAVSVEGHQWYWVYSSGMGVLDSYMEGGGFRVLDVDNRMVVPVGAGVTVLTSSVDVVHSWVVLSLGVKLDCVPGRLNQMTFDVSVPGVYYGQCSELCGVLHSFMPIVVEAVMWFAFLGLQTLMWSTWVGFKFGVMTYSCVPVIVVVALGCVLTGFLVGDSSMGVCAVILLGVVVYVAFEPSHPMLTPIPLQYSSFLLVFISGEFMLFLGFLCGSVSGVKGGWEGYYWGVEFWFVPVFMSVVLLSSGITATCAHMCLLSKVPGVYWWVWTVGLGAVFLGVQYHEWKSAAIFLLGGVAGAMFYVVTGFHGFHVLLGVFVNGMNGLMWGVGMGGVNGLKVVISECSIWYWHFVDVVWLFVLVGEYWFCF